jgi:hypothetical protein
LGEECAAVREYQVSLSQTILSIAGRETPRIDPHIVDIWFNPFVCLLDFKMH